MMKTGEQYIERLRDGRAIWLNGERVEDVTTHDAFRNAVASIAELFDFQCDPENQELMSYVPADSASPANRIWQLPASYEDLVQRRRALESWAELHAGFLGRAPDHVASCISGMYMGLPVFEACDPHRAGALADYYRYARDNDLYLTYVIINPQADRSKAPHEQRSEHLAAGLVDEDAEGITVRGAKMIGTAAVLSDEIFVTCIQPLKPGDERYALSFVVPIHTKGLNLLSRKSYEQHAGNGFDYPLSSRFDENDAVLYFDDVKVPWERVFISGDLDMCQKQFHATPAHVYQNYQAQIRLLVKLRFLVAVGRRIADINGITGFPQVREILGQLAAEAGLVEGLVTAMEAKGRQYGQYFIPDPHTLYAAQVLTQQLYPKVIVTLRDLAGGGLIMLPSSISDFANPEVADVIDRTQQSPVCDPRTRVKFFRMAWDAIGSEFGSRHTQYEMFYAGATFVTKNHSFRSYDWGRGSALLDRFLNGYSLEEELDALLAVPRV